MPSISELTFSRCTEPDGHILDACWFAEHTNTAVHSDILASFFNSAADSTIEIYLAGKSDGPNPKALETASNAFDATARYLPELFCPQNPESGWDFTTIWVPYQTVKMFFVRFWSEYGSPTDFGIKLDDCSFGPKGLLPLDCTSLGEVPSTVDYIIDELTTNLEDDDPELVDILGRVQAEEIMGVEIIPSLLSIVLRNRESLPLADHYQTLIDYVLSHANAA